jgi:hypothetical protein
VQAPSEFFLGFTMTHEIHPLADTVPLMSETEYQDLLADIRAHGLTDPITLYENKVLDGRNRLRACEEAGIEPKFDKFSGGDPAAFVLSKNIKRRHLTTSQKAMALLNMSEVVSKLQAEAQKRKRNSLRKGSKSPLPSSDGNGDLQRAEANEEAAIDRPNKELPQAQDKHAHTTLAELGQSADVSETTMQRAKYIREHGTPEDVKEVESGTKSVRQKEQEIRKRQKAKKKSGTRNESREQNGDQPKTEDELMALEWKTWLQTIAHTLCLDPNQLPPGEARDQVARFLRALESKVINQAGRDEMKEALEGLIGRCQQVLRQLALGKKRSSTAYPRRRARSTTSSATRSRARGNSDEMFELCF